MKIAVVDDDPTFAQEIKRRVQSFDGLGEKTVDIFESGNRLMTGWKL